MMENHATNEIIGNTADSPYINQLASQYGVAARYFGVTHPSLPNYLAAISGDFQGIWDDCKAGATVTCAPQEFAPDSGYTNKMELLTPDQIAKASSTPHLFSDIINNPARMQLIVPFTQFSQDITSSNVPNFVWISPDQCNDMHGLTPANAKAVGNPDCALPASGLDHKVIALGDKFLSTTVPAIMNSPAWKENSAIIIAWDEDDYAGYAGCCNSPKGVNGVTLGGANAPAIIITSKGPHAMTVSDTSYNHYSTLGTIEKLWNLGCLANTCNMSDADLMMRFFQF